mmetsp:Transcript_9677/g.13686  ORF Transcript_9677/g.13686 Transcript_9677/m.13686 type:complete len:725 (+) Transcript_9677:126-2300(+)|eukprot:CAMPEP_0184864738 /NCGR_PEP_ID=MMETSP0580-20130426/15950_1 /TAXON_ID=1118495 /ORGANISM="Dactyliosolen fragilissimus" /LENGTH=724 /DNA_ID=CAMNT_0027363649 /DNA_START=88 /DNA_END=2262 /DNA_ORIENTATION=-
MKAIREATARVRENIRSMTSSGDLDDFENVDNKKQMQSNVRVAVRVRNLNDRELSQGGKSLIKVDAKRRTIDVARHRKFTFDAVYDENVTQAGLYRSVRTSGLLESFLEGYNTTIMAYGQTGSGKTFSTMGRGTEIGESADADSNLGLIPRFMHDIFSTLRERETQCATCEEGDDICNKEEPDHKPKLIDYKLTASFLEVYGEEIHDLLDTYRQSLPLYDDANGHVVVGGLKCRPVTSESDALQFLHVGTMNRTTAATFMNQASSRSHAVFTIYLQQTEKSSTGGYGNDVEVTTTSRFTFVDLAGSERMKKSGVSGTKAKEGIAINKGLLALGNVINALADEKRLSRGEKMHVPYRTSKLTRLLQDSLGGTSKTLFLACISPSSTNEFETMSTLNYANRARNIKNAPTKHLDTVGEELQKLHAFNYILQCELVKARFMKRRPIFEDDQDSWDPNETSKNMNESCERLFERRDVHEYMEFLHYKAEQQRGVTPKKLMSDTRKYDTRSSFDDSKLSIGTETDDANTISTIGHSGASVRSAITNTSIEEDIALLDDILNVTLPNNPKDKVGGKDKEKILDDLIENVQENGQESTEESKSNNQITKADAKEKSKETKSSKEKTQDSGDSEVKNGPVKRSSSNASSKEESKKSVSVEETKNEDAVESVQLSEQERLLLQMKRHLLVYHKIKERHSDLMCEVIKLGKEKAALKSKLMEQCNNLLGTLSSQ